MWIILKFEIVVGFLKPENIGRKVWLQSRDPSNTIAKTTTYKDAACTENNEIVNTCVCIVKWKWCGVCSVRFL